MLQFYFHTDVEEGEVVEEPSAAVPLPTDQSDPTASGQQSPPGMDERVPRPRIQPIVWTPPASEWCERD